MALEFNDAPLGVAASSVAVVIAARDSDSGEHVECRIDHNVLFRKYGAQGTAPDKLRGAFNDNREEILEVAQRKYQRGQVVRIANGVILILSLEDFGKLSS